MHTVDSEVDSSALSGLDNLFFNLLLDLCHDLLDTCRVNTSVSNELVQCKACNLPADRVECAEHNGFGCVIDNNLNACGCLKSTYVTALTSDDAAFHLVIVNVEYCYRVLDSRFSGYSLYCLYHNLLCLLVGCHLGIVYDVVDV